MRHRRFFVTPVLFVMPVLVMSALAALAAADSPAAPAPVALQTMLDLQIPGATGSQLSPGSSITCDGTGPSGEPEIVDRDATQAGELACVRWKSKDGTTTFQRTVVAIKPDYAVVVDHVYPAPGAHSITRTFHFSAAPSISGTLAEGGGVRVQIFDSTDLTVTGTTLTATSSISGAAALYAVIIPPAKDRAPILADQVKAGHPLVRKLHLRYPDGWQHDLGFAWERRQLHIAGTEYFARAVCVKAGGATTQVITLP